MAGYKYHLLWTFWLHLCALSTRCFVRVDVSSLTQAFFTCFFFLLSSFFTVTICCLERTGWSKESVTYLIRSLKLRKDRMWSSGSAGSWSTRNSADAAIVVGTYSSSRCSFTAAGKQRQGSTPPPSGWRATTLLLLHKRIFISIKFSMIIYPFTAKWLSCKKNIIWNKYCVFIVYTFFFFTGLFLMCQIWSKIMNKYVITFVTFNEKSYILQFSFYHCPRKVSFNLYLGLRMDACAHFSTMYNAVCVIVCDFC